MPKEYDFVIVACARWETRFIVEWLTYYRAIGYQHVFLCCNDDDPAAFLSAISPFTMGEAPFVTARHHPVQGQQHDMYALFREDLAACRFVSFFDIDEFLRLPAEETIADFVERFPEDVDCILFNWVFFGPNGHKTSAPDSILAGLTRREAVVHPFTKYLARAEVVVAAMAPARTNNQPFWHVLLGAAIRSVNVLGEDAADYFVGFPAAATAAVNEPARQRRLLSTAVVHHYAFRSEAAFAERAARGLGGAFAGQAKWRDLAASVVFNLYLTRINAIPDDSLATFWPRSQRRQAAQAVTAAAAGDADLFMQFLSLGDNCEFGLVQRAAGAEPLDLLRFGGTGTDDVGTLLALRERFADFGLPPNLVVADHGRGEWIATNRRFRMVFHTHRKVADVDHATILASETRRLQFLAAKLCRDLDGGDKIAIRRSKLPVTEAAMWDMHRAVRAYGGTALLWVTEVDERHPAPTVIKRADGLLRGYIRRLAPYERAYDFCVADWRALCGEALRVWRE